MAPKQGLAKYVVAISETLQGLRVKRKIINLLWKSGFRPMSFLQTLIETPQVPTLMQSELFPEYSEDIPDAPIDPEKVLNNEALEAGGMVPVKAWVRTKSSKNALRIKKHQQKAENGEFGTPRKQLNIQAPTDEKSREMLKEISAKMLAGEIKPDFFEEMKELRQRAEAAERRAEAAEAEIQRLKARRWWRFWH